MSRCQQSSPVCSVPTAGLGSAQQGGHPHSTGQCPQSHWSYSGEAAEGNTSRGHQRAGLETDKHWGAEGVPVLPFLSCTHIAGAEGSWAQPGPGSAEERIFQQGGTSTEPSTCPCSAVWVPSPHPHACPSQGARTVGHALTGLCILQELLSSAGMGKSQDTVCWYRTMGVTGQGLSGFLQGCEELMFLFLCPVFARTPGAWCSSQPELLVFLRLDSSPLKLQAERGSDCHDVSLFLLPPTCQLYHK